MIKKVWFWVLIFSFSILNVVYATPSTHIWSPSTDVQPFKKWHITSDVYIPVKQNSDGTRANVVTNLGLTAGVLPFKKLNMELGFDYKTGYGDLDDYPMYFNTKLGIPEDAYGKYFPALVFGIYDIGTKRDKTNNNVVYGKAAKIFSIKDFSLGRFSLGYFQGNKKLLLNAKGKKDNNGVLICWERTMAEISDRLWLAVDYQGSKSGYGALNLGGSWKFSDNVSMIIGYDIYNNKNLADTVTVQFDIDF